VKGSRSGAAAFFLLQAAFGILSTAAVAAVTGDDFSETVRRIQAGVVMVEGRSKDERHFGSGFFLESPEVIVTAYHIIEGARKIQVSVPDVFLASDALVLAVSPEWDIAVLQVSWPEEMDFPGLRLAPGDEHLQPGVAVAYTGFGFGTNNAFRKILATYQGIISSTVPYNGGKFYYLSSMVNQGLSGCPLYLPESGAVVGVVTRQYGPKGLGVGFGGAVRDCENSSRD
jgi:S1-C subfamily serine protease